jgi:hypothetical protein
MNSLQQRIEEAISAQTKKRDIYSCVDLIGGEDVCQKIRSADGVRATCDECEGCPLCDTKEEDLPYLWMAILEETP